MALERLTLSDPFLRMLAKVGLLVFGLALAAVAGLAVAVVADWFMTRESGPGHPLLVQLGSWLPELTSTEVVNVKSVVAPIVSALPLIVTSVCFVERTVGQTSHLILNWTGRLFLLAILLALFLSIAGYLYLNPTDWGTDHDLREGGLANLKEWTRLVMSASGFYMAALLGLKVQS